MFRTLCYHLASMNRNYRYLLFSLIVTIIGFGLWIALEDYQEILQAIRKIGWSGFLFLCVFSLINYGLRYVRWSLLLNRLGDSVKGLDSWLCYLSGFALTTTPAKAGEAIRCFYFNRRHGVHYGHTLAAILTERTTDAVSSMFIAGFALYGFSQVRWVGIAFTLFIIAIVFLVVMPSWLTRITSWFRVIKIQALHKLLDLVPIFLQRSATLFAPKPFAGGVFIGLVAWSAEAYAFAWLAHQLGGEASTLMYMSIFAIAMVAGALSFMPGGLGGAEVVLFVLMKATGMGDAEAITATLLCRLATLWFAVALGLLSILWLESRPMTKVLAGGEEDAGRT